MWISPKKRRVYPQLIHIRDTRKRGLDHKRLKKRLTVYPLIHSAYYYDYYKKKFRIGFNYMYSFKREFALAGLCLMTLVLSFSACTRKNNLTGNNWSDTKPLTFTDSLSASGFSFADTANVSGFEGSLLVAKMGAVESVPMIRFTGLPKSSLLSGGNSTVTEAKLLLSLKRRSAEPRSTLKLNFFRIKGRWTADSTNVVPDDSLVVSGIAEFTVPVVPAGSDSLLSIPVPNEVIRNWQVADSTYFSLAIRCSDNSWAEFYSMEGSSSQGPKLEFKYRFAADAANSTLKEYSSFAITDSYRLNAPLGTQQQNVWLLRNISPSRIFLKFNLNPNNFRAMDGAMLDSLKLKRVTVNKAELVLYIKNNPYYGSTIPYALRSFNVTKDSVSTAISLQEADYEFLTLTPSNTGLVRGDSIVVNITPQIQGYLSGNIVNKGVMIRSLQEMQNFGELEFWNDEPSTLPENRPKLRVKYTPPYL